MVGLRAGTAAFRCPMDLEFHQLAPESCGVSVVPSMHG